MQVFSNGRGFASVPAWVLFAAVALLGTPTPARAQLDVWVPEIPLTRSYAASARALGMGGAYLAVSDDAAALQYNPAGLARIQRLEFLGSVTDLHRGVDTDFHGGLQNADITRTRISALSFAYPVPTYRGSMVIAVGYHAPWPLDREYGRLAEFTEGELARSIQEDLLDEGQVGEWSFGYAVDASPTLSMGFSASWIHGGWQQDWVYRDTSGGLEIYDIHDITDVDLNGFTGSLGILSRMGEWGRLGLTVNLPRWINLKGTYLDAIYEDEYDIDEQMTLPYSVGIGVSGTLPNLLLAADARFTDWTQIDYEGPLRYYENGDENGPRRFAYRRTWDLHLGGEYLLDGLGLMGMRVRAGFAWEPVPYGILLEDVRVVETTGGSFIDVPVYEKAHFDPDRYTFTAGVGVLLAQSLTVDAAFAAGKFKRDGLNLSEEETERRLLLTAALRLD